MQLDKGQTLVHNALLILLKTMHHKGLNKIQVLGDSKLPIEWANQHLNIENIG
jgi:hypothetical protein